MAVTVGHVKDSGSAHGILARVILLQDLHVDVHSGNNNPQGATKALKLGSAAQHTKLDRQLCSVTLLTSFDAEYTSMSNVCSSAMSTPVNTGSKALVCFRDGSMV